MIPIIDEEDLIIKKDGWMMNKKRSIIFFILVIILRILAGDRADAMSTGIIMSIRFPRTVSAFLLGGALALSGYLLQTFFGNPIVGPFVLGISSGAKLSVAIFMIFFLSIGREM